MNRSNRPKITRFISNAPGWVVTAAAAIPAAKARLPRPLTLWWPFVAVSIVVAAVYCGDDVLLVVPVASNVVGNVGSSQSVAATMHCEITECRMLITCLGVSLIWAGPTKYFRV